MKNKKQILIVGSFVLAALLVWFWLKPTEKDTGSQQRGAAGGFMPLMTSNKITAALR